MIVIRSRRPRCSGNLNEPRRMRSKLELKPSLKRSCWSVTVQVTTIPLLSKNCKFSRSRSCAFAIPVPRPANLARASFFGFVSVHFAMLGLFGAAEKRCHHEVLSLFLQAMHTTKFASAESQMSRLREAVWTG